MDDSTSAVTVPLRSLYHTDASLSAYNTGHISGSVVVNYTGYKALPILG